MRRKHRPRILVFTLLTVDYVQSTFALVLAQVNRARVGWPQLLMTDYLTFHIVVFAILVGDAELVEGLNSMLGVEREKL